MKNYEDGITVLSLFDGCSAAYLALKKAGFKIKDYYSCENDKNAIAVQNYHYSGKTNFHQIGDIRDLVFSSHHYYHIDLIIMGSPCTQLSSVNTKDRSGLAGPDSKLFYDAIKIMKEIAAFHTSKKLYFLAENVASMSNANKDTITESLKGIFPDSKMLKIDSALVAPAHRRRLYWTNMPNVSVPISNGKKYQDIIVNGFVDKEKANVLLSSNLTSTNGIRRYYSMNIGNIIFKDKAFAQLSTEQKLLQYPLILKESGYNGKLRLKSSKYDFLNGCYRLPSVLERERLMTIPDGYVSDVPNVSKTEKNKILGLSFTVDVIMHLLKSINS
jgi:site-specific DNA-cytosine methylase